MADRAINRHRQSVEQFLVNHGWVHGQGRNFYFNGLGDNAHPHLHLIVTNRDEEANRYEDIRDRVEFLGLTFGPEQNQNNFDIIDHQARAQANHVQRRIEHHFPDRDQAGRLINMINNIAGMGLRLVEV
ncbi:hypothetical protein BKI52_11590 [marine bacterium AO1-C]|nr:hypothetical protein BKI52_11590 [marine bacterium AO1-C]